MTATQQAQLQHQAYHAAIAAEAAHTAMFVRCGTSFSPVIVTNSRHELTWPGETDRPQA